MRASCLSVCRTASAKLSVSGTESVASTAAASAWNTIGSSAPTANDADSSVGKRCPVVVQPARRTKQAQQEVTRGRKFMNWFPRTFAKRQGWLDESGRAIIGTAQEHAERPLNGWIVRDQNRREWLDCRMPATCERTAGDDIEPLVTPHARTDSAVMERAVASRTAAGSGDRRGLALE